MHRILEPKLIAIFREGYTKKQFSADVVAGVIVGIVALPLAIAFAIASGVKPEQGLYTAVVAGFIIAALGGSRAQVSGPTGAFVVIVYGIVHEHGYAGLAVATMLAGLFLIIMGAMRMGVLLKFIPYPVTVGFTSGIALIIFSSQTRDFLGLQIASVPADFVEKWAAYFANLHTFSPHALGVGLLALALIVLWPRVTHRIPGSFVALLVMTAIVHLFDVPVETIGSRFGEVPNNLPAPRMPDISWKMITEVFSPAVTIALLAAIESLLSAVVADGMLGTRHRSNMELIAQGVGNFLSPVFGGIPATGAIARTATNIKNGGRTPVAGLVHALVLLLIMLFFAQYAALIPMPVLAAILIYVAYNMSEWHMFVKLMRSPRSDVVVLFATFLLTVLIDLTVAIQVGVVLAAFLFLNRMANVTQANLITKELQNDVDELEDDPNAISRRQVPPGVEVFEIHGPLFFGAIDQFKDTIRLLEKSPRVLILRIRNVLAVDATALRALEVEVENARKHGNVIILSGVHAQPLHAMRQAGLLEKLGEENVCANIDDALNRARGILGLPPVPRPGPFVATVAREKHLEPE
ncbi:MAG: C4-dicarboxylic acid transporter DauA [bacterium]|nr:C4-dicarboxylic acid transporter DauA [bacterium]MCK6561251.1 sulfate permease [bacterium]